MVHTVRDDLMQSSIFSVAESRVRDHSDLLISEDLSDEGSMSGAAWYLRQYHPRINSGEVANPRASVKSSVSSGRNFNSADSM